MILWDVVCLVPDAPQKDTTKSEVNSRFHEKPIKCEVGLNPWDKEAKAGALRHESI